MTSPFRAKIPRASQQLLVKKEKSRMAEEFKKYKDILKWEREEFEKQLVKRGRYLIVFFILIKINRIEME